MRSVGFLSSTVLLACALLPVQPAHGYAPGCSAGMRSDFNGDGYSDAVVADPYASVGALLQVGRVNVLYGDGDARIGEGVVTCERKDTDRYGRVVALCRVYGEDLSLSLQVRVVGRR